ncbi:Zinc/iron permease [Crucibulum laeve]|uniref:Zinc/iron permease n=1 Tax=Crucibulum laeve TaxID=68775 RepID=A0A5C3M605_9AGAR|nr:Zinc/iron permease [Crucibulum laeve]
MILVLAVMSALLAVSSFGFGMIPLSFALSKSHLDKLAALGTGLLLGAALGVIIPEGIEATVEAHPGAEIPTSSIALSLVIGFTLMLIIEQLISPNAHSHSMHDQLPMHSTKPRVSRSSSHVEFDADLGDLESEHRASPAGFREVQDDRSLEPDVSIGKGRAFPLTFGLVIHGLADGLALGVSSLSRAQPAETSNLSLIVFLALIIHKAPTSLALTTSLLATGLPRQDCKRYLAAFASSTPLSAIGSYLLFSFLGDGGGGWTGIALLVSGGTFLYVATVLQPVSSHAGPATDEMRPAARVLFISIGIFIPFILSALLGHGH